MVSSYLSTAKHLNKDAVDKNHHSFHPDCPLFLLIINYVKKISKLLSVFHLLLFYNAVLTLNEMERVLAYRKNRMVLRALRKQQNKIMLQFYIISMSFLFLHVLKPPELCN